MSLLRVIVGRSLLVNWFSFFLLLCFGVLIGATGSCSDSQNSRLAPKTEIDFEVKNTLINDYSIFNFYDGPFLIAQPRNANEVSQLIQRARDGDFNIKVRGRGHSMNGLAVPQTSKSLERLLLTNRLDYYEVLGEGTVKIGAGIAVLDAKAHFEKMGLSMRVFNGGQVAPSIGGFVSAGGANAAGSGGFWQTVESLTVVDGLGVIRVVKNTDKDFKWFFGSMGQLGVIVDVTIQFQGAVDDSFSLDKGNISNKVIAKTPVLKHTFSKNTFGFFVFSPSEKVAKVEEKVRSIIGHYEDVLAFGATNRVDFNFEKFNPPLLYPRDGGFVALAFWGTANELTTEKEILKLEKEYSDWIEGDEDLYRYLQVEYLSSLDDISTYYSQAVKLQFKDVKSRWDPDEVFPRYL